MGVIGEGRTAISDAAELRAQAEKQDHDAVVDGLMADLDTVLAEPEFTGDAETALVHYFGREAFDNESLTQPYIELEESIKADTDLQVPVLFIYQDRDEYSNPGITRSIFVTVDRDKPFFSSTRARREDVVMNVMANTTAAVTDRELVLVGPTTAFRGDLLETDDPLPGHPESLPHFSLNASSVADGSYGKGMPSSYNFNDFHSDCFDNDPRIFVGWGKIEATVIDKLTNNRPFLPDLLQDILKVKYFFRASQQMDAVWEHAPRMARLFEATERFQKTLGSIATGVLEPSL